MLLVKTQGFLLIMFAWSFIHANAIRMWLMVGRNAQIICMEQTLIAKLSVWCHSCCFAETFLLFFLFWRVCCHNVSRKFCKKRVQHLLRGSVCNTFPLVNRRDLINLSESVSLEPRGRKSLTGGDVDFLFHVFTFLQHIKKSFFFLPLSPSVALTRLALKSLEADSQCSVGVCAPEVAKAHTSLYSRRRTDTCVKRVKV